MIERKHIPLDPRVYLFLFIAALVSTLMIHSEWGIFIAFLIVLSWQLIAGYGYRIIVYLFYYAVLYGITRLSILQVTAHPDAIFAVTLSNLGMIGRRAIFPILFAMIIVKLPTGSLIGALNKLLIPKSIGIGLATMLRFFPTIREESRAIRDAQKFRGVGVGFWGTLIHLPQVINYVYIPLIMRIIKLSEELSASVMVRGVDLNNRIESFYSLKLDKRDISYLLVTLTALLTVILLDDRIWSRV